MRGLDFILGMRVVNTPLPHEVGNNIIDIESRVINIDRSIPFDPNTLIGGGGWFIKDQDKKSLALGEIDLDQIFLIVDEHSTDDPSNICLDGQILEAILSNDELIPERWKKYNSISFYGTILSNVHYNYSSVLILFSDDEDEWNYGHIPLYCADVSKNHPSAVLKTKL